MANLNGAIELNKNRYIAINFMLRIWYDKNKLNLIKYG